jgi:hypothetical protein
MKNAFISGVVLALVVAAASCRQGDPSIDPKTPPNSPLPTKLDRPDDSKESKDDGKPAPAMPTTADAGK